MIMVVMIRDGLSFLIVWGIMALSSFLLVIFDAEETTIMKTGISYLIQMYALIENSRLPVDDPKTHLELTMYLLGIDLQTT